MIRRLSRCALLAAVVWIPASATAWAQYPNPTFVPNWNNHGKMALVPPFPGDPLKFLRGNGTWDTLGSADAPGGSLGQIQYNAGGVFGGTSLPTGGLLKGAAGPSFVNAIAGTDYLAPTGNGSGLVGLLATQISSVPAGVLKGSSGAFASAVAGTDFLTPTGNGSGLVGLLASQIGSVPAGLLKGSGGAFTAAVSGTDYAPATSGSSILKGNALGGFANAASGTDYAPATSGSAILKGNGTGGFSSATAGTDYVAPGGSAGAIDVTTQAVDNNTTKAASTAFVLGQAASATPLIDGTAAAGTSTRYARGDHVHPTDTTRAPLASPGLTGTPTTPTAAVDTSTTQIASTAFVLGQAASATPAALGTAAVGTSTRYARADHVHAMPTKSDVGLGNVDNTSDATKNAATATLTNKTISGASNTLSNIGNSSLTNSSVTVAGHAVSLGASTTVACADLSNGATGCSTATGTSGATIPLLNGNNTHSGTETFTGVTQSPATPSAKWNYDCTDGTNPTQTTSVAAAGTYTFSAGGGLILLRDITTTGSLALLIALGAASDIVYQRGTDFATSVTASKYSITYNGSGAYVLTNSKAAAATFAMCLTKMTVSGG